MSETVIHRNRTLVYMGETYVINRDLEICCRHTSKILASGFRSLGQIRDYVDECRRNDWLIEERTRQVANGGHGRSQDTDQLTPDLRVISAVIRAQQRHVRNLEQERNEIVRQALANGWTHAQIAEATGLTRGRVGQIAARTTGGSS